jgi:hypothetical protein
MHETNCFTRCPPAETHETNYFTRCPPGETHDLAELTRETNGFARCPPGETHETDCFTHDLAELVRETNGFMHHIPEHAHVIAHRLNACGAVLLRRLLAVHAASPLTELRAARVPA